MGTTSNALDDGIVCVAPVPSRPSSVHRACGWAAPRKRAGGEGRPPPGRVRLHPAALRRITWKGHSTSDINAWTATGWPAALPAGRPGRRSHRNAAICGTSLCAPRTRSCSTSRRAAATSRGRRAGITTALPWARRRKRSHRTTPLPVRNLVRQPSGGRSDSLFSPVEAWPLWRCPDETSVPFPCRRPRCRAGGRPGTSPGPR